MYRKKLPLIALHSVSYIVSSVAATERFTLKWLFLELYEILTIQKKVNNLLK